jgi:signal transduction histidine kinase/CheY-like chemotaxis protein
VTLPILAVAIRHETDTVAVRQRARQIARLLGFDNQDQTRIATAVSEIARNAFRYARGGRVEFIIEGRSAPQLFLIQISDEGPGISNLSEILEGRYTSQTGMGLGIIGARRLMDQFEIESQPGRGSKVWLKKVFPRKTPLITREGLVSLTAQLAAETPRDAFAELELQNQELLRTLDELRKKQEDLRRVNQELEDTNRGVVALYAELDEKADHLRRADELKSKFLSNMSHEFRSPLNSIIALTDLLLTHSDGPLNTDQTEQVGYVRKAADDLYELVNDLLDLAKVEAGKVEVKPVSFDTQSMFGALRGMLRPLFLNHSVRLVFEDCSELPPLYNDEGKVSQILRNFLSNALKFTERGEVRVSAVVKDDRIVFSVADTGIGIAKEDQDRIFQDFSQIDSPVQRKVKGTGLGLPLSRKLARLLQGDVTVASEPGLGSTFSLEIPIQWHGEVPTPASIPVEESNPVGTPVLVVENRPDTVLMYSKWLRDTEFRATYVGSVREARKRIHSYRPELIVLDILLEGEDSWELLASLKNSPETSEIPIVLITTVDDPQKGFHLGADDYLTKPITREAMLASMHRLVARPRTGHVLIIDDDANARYFLKRRLRASGLRIDEAVNGEEGIARAVADPPSIIFLDVRMPGMDGLEVVRRLKTHTRTKDIPVTIHTSMQLADEERATLMEDVAAIISKSDIGFDFGALVAQLGGAARVLTHG